MLEGPITIDYGLTRHQFVHLVCSFYFFDNCIVWNLFPLTWVWFRFVVWICLFFSFSQTSLWTWICWPFFHLCLPSPATYALTDLSSVCLSILWKSQKESIQGSSLTPRYLWYSSVLYHFNSHLEVVRKPGVHKCILPRWCFSIVI